MAFHDLSDMDILAVYSENGLQDYHAIDPLLSSEVTSPLSVPSGGVHSMDHSALDDFFDFPYPAQMKQQGNPLSPASSSSSDCESDGMPLTPLSSGAESLSVGSWSATPHQPSSEMADDVLKLLERASSPPTPPPAAPAIVILDRGRVEKSHPATKSTSSYQPSQQDPPSARARRSTTHPVRPGVSSSGPSSPAAPVSGDSSSQGKNNTVVKTVTPRRGVKRKTDQIEQDERDARGKVVSEAISRNEKNALAARENRLKKKKEWEDLKMDNASLREENQHLCKENGQQAKTIEALEEELEYYKSLLFNQSSLAAFLMSMNPSPNVKLRSTNQSSTAGKMSGGVCLHVNGADASLEFCSKCSLNAQCSFNS